MARAPWAKWFLLPLPLAALFMGVYAVSGSASDCVVTTGVLVGKLFTLVAFVLAATRFSWGDRLHAAWWLLAFNMTLLLAKDVFFGGRFFCPQVDIEADSEATVRAVMVAAANVASTVAMLLLARAFRNAGLAAVASKPIHRLVKVGVVPIAFAIFIVTVREQMAGVSADVLHTFLAVVIPNFADFVSFAVIGPLALTAFFLRGGSLAWPWALLALGNAMWLFWDLATTMTHLSGVSVEVVRLLALGYTGSAGLEQWWALRVDPHLARVA
ncbi:MAG TPA: hypothetical protein VNO21_17340 [Polyangiaceae bacterium]|nr:hypothetical protein [Polyangiaceae bacterium]